MMATRIGAAVSVLELRGEWESLEAAAEMLEADAKAKK